jgi:hypothetical protein
MDQPQERQAETLLPAEAQAGEEGCSAEDPAQAVIGWAIGAWLFSSVGKRAIRWTEPLEPNYARRSD